MWCDPPVARGAQRLRLLLAAFFSRTMRTWFGRHVVLPVFPKAQLWLLRVTRGRFNITDLLVPSLVLQHTGARTGRPRETPLMCWPLPDGSFLVAGSNWGLPAHPAWTVNLLAHLDARIVFGGRTIDVHAELLIGAEREQVWPVLEAQWPNYRAYERDAGRELRIFRLVPR